jgi:uncharacterized protein YecT (DUF1311 family)
MLALGQPAAAQRDPDDCGNRNSTVEIVECLQGRTAVWDRRLNSAYQKSMAALSGRQREQLRTAQRLWIQYRDANCLYYALGEGTISRVEAAECLRRMTAQRARELEGEVN